MPRPRRRSPRRFGAALHGPLVVEVCGIGAVGVGLVGIAFAPRVTAWIFGQLRCGSGCPPGRGERILAAVEGFRAGFLFAA